MCFRYLCTHYLFIYYVRNNGNLTLSLKFLIYNQVTKNDCTTIHNQNSFRKRRRRQSTTG